MENRTMLWKRVDVAGAEYVAVDGRRARGVQIAHENLAYRLDYELTVDEAWRTSSLALTAEGAGFRREVTLTRTGEDWRVTTAERGDLPKSGFAGIEDPSRLHGVLDVDLAASPLTNTLPIRRLRVRDAEPGSVHAITAAWVLVPSLTVVPDRQEYTVIDRHRVRYRSGDFSAEIELDDDGYVVRYEGLAERA